MENPAVTLIFDLLKCYHFVKKNHLLSGIFLWVLAGFGLLNLATFQKHLLESVWKCLVLCSFQRELLDVIHHWGHTRVYSVLQ